MDPPRSQKDAGAARLRGLAVEAVVNDKSAEERNDSAQQLTLC